MAEPQPSTDIPIVSDYQHTTDEEKEDGPLKFGDEPDQTFDPNQDDENEAWVYQNLRSGQFEDFKVRNQQQIDQAKMLKPRNSDAVLSCPCCFTIVCMDCQQHERYQTQYRAMFVMNIGVQWDKQLIHDDKSKGLVQRPLGDQKQGEQEHTYYSVHCISCKTEVAALDLKEEIYHFFGCMASG